MKKFLRQVTAVSIALAFVISLIRPGIAWGESEREKAQVILDEVKQRKLEGQIKAKQTEAQRLDEDYSKRQEEAETLHRSIDTITSAIGEAGGSLDRLTAEKKRLTDLLELTNQRITAEKLKLEGLKVLSDAQVQARDLVLKQSEETGLLSGVANAELKLLKDRQAPPLGEDVPKEDTARLNAEISELKKKLLKSEKLMLTAARTARETMTAANAKLLEADKADAKAKQTAAIIEQEKTGTPTDAAPLEPVAAPPSGDSRFLKP